jgi:hypothetical protein
VKKGKDKRQMAEVKIGSSIIRNSKFAIRNFLGHVPGSNRSVEQKGGVTCV